ncbi:elongation factor Ts [Trifolium pratense]|uniref:Elongation factor Ts, mitochondrial n=3 Tax=Trifolium TaxID=3898 RepID=A0A2K3NX03_TRIPR|nr:elongation factor Ts [Trifolium pratense]
MNPIISCSVGNSSIIPGVAYSTRKNNSLTRLNFSRSFLKHGSSTRRFLFPSFVVNGVFPQNKRICSYHKKSRTSSISATETEVSVEVSDSTVADEVSTEPSSDEVGTSEDSSPKSDANAGSLKSKRTRPVRKSTMPPVKEEDLVPGAAFTGKVMSIQPFGAFVDFGAFTDGLVHISMLSDGFVKDVSSIVSVGQEVKVKLLEVNAETRRISLSMRENADTGKQRKDASNSTEKSGRWDSPNSSPRRDSTKKTTKLVVGQELQGTVKNAARKGSFISLPEGEEGFLPLDEEDDDGFSSVTGKSSLEVGQEVKVRVLRISRGQATLTMKREGAVSDKAPAQNLGVDVVATNPFVLAFRKNKDISKFLDEREKLQNEVKSSTTKKEEDVEASSSVGSSTTVADDESNQESIINGATELQTETISENLASEGDLSDVNPIIEEAIQTDTITNDVKADSPVEVADESVIESGIDQIVAEDEKQSETDDGKEELVAATQTDSDAVEPPPVVTESDISSIAPAPQETEAVTEENDQVPSPESPATEEVQEQIPVAAQVEEEKEEVANASETNSSLSSSNEQTDITALDEGSSKDETAANDQVPSPESPATEEVQEQIPVAAQVEDVSIASETNSSLSSSNGQTGITASDEALSKATISPALVKQLREETGAGMMDCKNALSESEGDIIKAQEFLRKKGLASADKKAARATAEGRIGSYIHDSRIGVLIEVNCETDFVSRGDIFKELVDDIAMQVAACPQVEYVVTEDVPQEFVNKETEIEMQKEDLASKPEQIRSRIVEGRIRKRLENLALLEQPYIKNDKLTVKDVVKQTIATIGENIKVTRFVRFNLGEGLEKKSQDFAAEVAAQTAAKPVTTPVQEEPAAAEAKETEPKKPTVVISASLVKQLREETGAGMMDCKKALAETEGDLEKAQAYLRKKGLSSADKKSGRLAAEGRIGTYIHDSRIGVLIEVNCETDFVGRSEKFKELVDDIAMQVVASPQVQFVSIEDIPETTVKKEKEIEMQREDLASKPENIREKIVEGRISKRLGELALLEQPFIKDDKVLVKDLVKQSIAAIGENIKVRRFVRFTLGETVEKETISA